MKSWLLALSLILPLAAAAQTPPPAAVAITFDDLPYVSVPAEDDAALAAIMAAFRAQVHACLQHARDHCRDRDDKGLVHLEQLGRRLEASTTSMPVPGPSSFSRA